MTLPIDTIVGNKKPSTKLVQMLTELKNSTGAVVSWFDRVEVIKQQAHKEGFNDQQAKLLLKQYLNEFLKKDQIKYILYDKPRIEKQKKLIEKAGNNPLDVNTPINEPETVSIPTDYKVVISDQVLEEETKQLQQQEQGLEHTSEASEARPDYEGENLKMQLDKANNKITELTTQIKNLEEKNKQLEARTRVSPSNNFPALQGNNLRTKIVINQLFREILYLKGSKVIYANVVIDVAQNKYVRLERA
jgi:DNA repair exonuclease SbcCD ATPase subunit